ncbi:response regulator transcription factor [Peptostreptococcus faecalis]|uniref:response regulator transcription factor n=1 Tax=Peptostreptococcus faecalis TaxID=2045015 RepID=UPI000C7D5E39|nr:response regulator transcription factor [Peptostreptococcus faecalis]
MIKRKILIVDDDIYISNVLFEVLSREGYEVLIAYSGTEALLVLSEFNPDLILLDLMLPGLNGEDILPKIKDIPVIIVSAKVDMDNKVDLLLGGACDYITKPFDIKEILARICVHLRSSTSFQANSILIFKDLKLNINTQTASVEEREINLTRTESSILKVLMKNQTQVVAKSVLLDSISYDTPDCTESSLKIHVSNLRKKLRKIDDRDYIEAVWGIGYKLV